MRIDALSATVPVNWQDFTEHIIPVAYAGGLVSGIYVRVYPDLPRQFRFTLDDALRPIHSGETLRAAVLREHGDVCRRQWPENPEYWPVPDAETTHCDNPAAPVTAQTPQDCAGATIRTPDDAESVQTDKRAAEAKPCDFATI